MKKYKAFVYMFYAMDKSYSDNPNEKLGNYLSGLNPFLFEEEGSADPAEYEEFKKRYTIYFKNKNQTTEEIYNFCKTYLSQNAPKIALAAFEKTEKAEWVDVFDSVP